jgi:hypothetical protein
MKPNYTIAVTDVVEKNTQKYIEETNLHIRKRSIDGITKKKKGVIWKENYKN